MLACSDDDWCGRCMRPLISLSAPFVLGSVEGAVFQGGEIRRARSFALRPSIERLSYLLARRQPPTDSQAGGFEVLIGLQDPTRKVKRQGWARAFVVLAKF